MYARQCSGREHMAEERAAAMATAATTGANGRPVLSSLTVNNPQGWPRTKVAGISAGGNWAAVGGVERPLC
jgi:hypothetical protein